MNVVNCKVKFIRPEYKNLKEWMENENNVYIGRAGVVFVEVDGVKQRWPKQSSKFCNPFKISNNMSRDDVIKMYKEYIIKRIDDEPSLKLELFKLRDKNLGCWCHPEACHGDVLVDLTRKIEQEFVYNIRTEFDKIFIMDPPLQAYYSVDIDTKEIWIVGYKCIDETAKQKLQDFIDDHKLFNINNLGEDFSYQVYLIFEACNCCY